MRRAGILLAGGVGSRFQGEKPKQFLPLMGRPLLDYSLEKLLLETEVLCVVCHPQWKEELASLPHWREDILVTDGGKTRQESVYLGLCCLKDYQVEGVAIHDGARPFVSRDLLQRGWARLFQTHAAIPVLPIAQTVALVKDGVISHYLDRSSLVTIQTPQFFRFEVIWQAHTLFQERDATDDSQLLQKLGLSVDTIHGDPWNIKITTPEDMILAEAYVKQGVGV
ncbi:MAG: 2-C-methyl-D-erythritol 4-phosphate cytidylyltransferase [Brevinematales bacterium]|nr:2-C-methyl-D-erythritol 4-phosphate cytidylyltransferase [Brevinematales bacterium]